MANLQLNKLNVFSNSSFLSNSSKVSTSTFLRSFNRLVYQFNKQWVGTKLAMEDSEQRLRENDSLTNLSQRFNSYEVFTGYGDSTKVFVEVGYINRVNDSLRANRIEKVNTSNTFYLKSRIIKNKILIWRYLQITED